MNNLIINLALTGMVPRKEDTPFVPVSIEEIVETTIACSKIGASMIHIHGRDSEGNPTYKKEIYGEIISKIRRINPELILVASTSGRNFSEFYKRSEVLNLEGIEKPDMATLTLSSLNFQQGPSINSPETIMNLAKTMKEKGIKPELEVFDIGMVNYCKYLIKKGLIDPPYYFNIILGNIASAQSSLLHGGLIISELPENSYYSIGGIGNSQKIMNALGIIAAHGVRVGIEDNIWYHREKNILASNEDLVKRVVHIARAYERDIASPKEVRELLVLNQPIKL